METNLREYQREACLAVKERASKKKKVNLLGVLPTASGKSVILRNIPFALGKPSTLVLAHTTELIHQLTDHFAKAHPGLSVGVEQAESRARETDTIVIASMQSMGTKVAEERLKAFTKDRFSTIIIDEAHRAMSNSYKNIINYFEYEVLLGVTATPFRSDGEQLSDLFDEVAFTKTIQELWQEGEEAEDGPYLSDLVVKRVYTTSDISSLTTASGDFDPDQLAFVVNTDTRNSVIISGIEQHATDRNSVIVFCANKAHVIDMCSQLVKRGHSAEFVLGDTNKNKRRKTISDFREGRFRFLVLCNVGMEGLDIPRVDCVVLARPTKSYTVLNQQIGRGLRVLKGKENCLDSETEVLTSDGWKNIDTIKESDSVCNWTESSELYFSPIVEIVKRDRLPGERMFSVETRRNSLRVTEGHRVVFRSNTGKSVYNEYRPWKVGTPEACTSSFEIPISGILREGELTWNTPSISKRGLPLGRSISRMKYDILKRNPKLSRDEAKLEAIDRIFQKNSMRFKEVSELSIEECGLIGFWLGDGHITHGHNYGISQCIKYENNIKWIDSILTDLNIDHKKHIKKIKTTLGESTMVTYSLPQGVYGGAAKRSGVFSIKPYLQRLDFSWIKSLKKDQFLSFYHGLWRADGNHRTDSILDKSKSYSVTGQSLEMFNAIQEAAVYNGMGLAIHPRSSKGGALSYKKPMYGVSLYESMVRGHKGLKEEDSWTNERVWCVQNQSGFLVTRRHGIVSILGNCMILDIADIVGRVPVLSVSDMFGVRGLDFLDTPLKAATKQITAAQQLGVQIDDGDTIADVERKVKLIDRVASGTVRITTQAQIVDLFNSTLARSNQGYDPKFNWIKINSNEFILPIKSNDTIKLKRDTRGVWDCTRGMSCFSKKTRNGEPPLKWADTRVKELADGEWRSKYKDSGFRKKKASKAQLDFLSKMGVELYSESINTGTVNDILDSLLYIKNQKRIASSVLRNNQN